ncbi:transglycosylase domain-containing protein [Nonomuraea sp. NPDC001831]|uniref:transglycosylase domain-containing protein n=1 Tax=Nonomuraea sp. NPDC001831 TaxID=3364340 RepID=UPI00368346BD
MSAQPYGDPASGPQPQRGAPQGREEPAPRGRSRARQDTRSLSNQETMVSDAPPRRSRRASGQGEPPEPPGPPGRPDGKRGGWRRFVPSWKIVVASVVVLAAGIFGMIMVAYNLTPVPEGTQASAVAQQSTLYYRNGKVLAKLGVPRQTVTIDKMAQTVKDATVAIENKTFYEDSGVSISGMARSVWMTATGQQLQGASTITQQMARGYYDGLSQEVSVKRKLKEIFVAVKLNQSLSKEEILARYLNTVNFGLAYGVEAASQAYFGKNVHAKDLTPEQGAYLAARIQRPSWGPDDPGLRERWSTTIKYMAEQWPDKYGDLPAKAKFPKVYKGDTKEVYAGLRGYMITQVLEELKQRKLTPDMVRSGGYQITSTFDEKLMKAAKTAVETELATRSKEYHAGLAAVDPRNGRVLAFYGGSNFLTDPFNEPFDANKQAASAFKPYVLAAWLQAGYSLKSYVPGNQTVPKVIPGQQNGGFRNSHNVGQAVDVVKATAQSVNTAYVSMAFKLPRKLDEVKELVENAGFDKGRMDQDVKEHQFQFAIGSALVKPVEQAAGYSIFANGGKYTKYHVVQDVKLNGQVVYPEQRTSTRVIDAEVAADATTAMQEVLRSGTAAGQGLGNRPAAGKTGTNNDEKEAWFVGYTPQISTAVGFYREQCVTKTGKIVQPRHSNCPVTPDEKKPSKKYGPNNPYTRAKEVSLGFEGAGPPTATWRRFMLAAHEGKPIEQFPQKADIGLPENIVERPVPTPTPTATNPFDDGADNPFDDGGDQNCLAAPCNDDSGDVTDDSQDTGIPEADDHGILSGGGGGRAPDSRPTGSSQMSARHEEW